MTRKYGSLKNAFILIGFVMLFGCGEAPPARTPDGVFIEPLPALASWAHEFQDADINSHFKLEAGNCIGYLDLVESRFKGEPSGVTIRGWAWDSVAAKPYDKFLVVDESDQIVGAGFSEGNREDVLSAIAQVTQPDVGFLAIAKRETGKLKVFGVYLDTKSACQLGTEIQL
ncbi:hypothetical protein [Hirschia baltica]|uniref:Lipoprotein n=1 Tax=Hirschia baltica (strain ATCC 49814 / DSM 5838 / IFAM 1418) TaxID=582402 RepID=C6XS44_HIRBI|nr:hypothetical protein [Hirschia baltica]ACT60885.1 hypothetical protein Hbal_3218 [Hirschia baltica ATCC 49814]